MHMAWDDASEHARWFLGGAFDGDGCVHVTSRQLSPRLVVTQAERGLKLLHTFRDACGGAIYAGPRPKNPDRHQPTWAWCITGLAAACLAERLAPYTLLKKRQLLMAAVFQEKLQKDTKQRLATRLVELKHVPHTPIATLLHSPYAAGFVDTDGSLRAYPNVGIHVTQKYPAIAHAFRDTFGVGTVHETPTACRWHVSGASAKVVVRCLEPFLVVKKPQAHIVLHAQLTKDVGAREALKPLQGNQGRSTRSAQIPTPTPHIFSSKSRPVGTISPRF